MSKETKPDMTAEEFLRCWIEDKEDIPLAQEHLNSVIRGKLYEFADWYIAHEGYSITNREIDMFLSNNPC